MSAELFTIAAASGSIEDVASKLLAELDSDDAGDKVLAVMIVQLARAVDSAANRGRASAAAMAAKELREAIAELRSRETPADGPEDEFAHFRTFILDDVSSSGSAS